MKDRNWTKLYGTYLKTYSKKSKRSPVEMESKYSFGEFKDIYKAAEQDKLEEIRQGKRKVANVTQDLVARQQLYEYSKKQAPHIQQAIFEYYGVKISQKDIRIGKDPRIKGFWDDVKAEELELQSQGYSKKDAHSIVMSGISWSP